MSRRNQTRQVNPQGSRPPPATPRTWPVCLLLALITMGVFSPACGFEFVNYDDPLFITENLHVQGGFTWPNLTWAFTNNDAYLWHPLTWLSHMVDYQAFGMKPAGHHLTNILIHTASTVLLFLVLRRLTGAVWRSAMVAALFAWHPLHVQSVAWVAERKDVLSGFFWMLTLWTYCRYVEKVTVRRYAAVVICLVLALLSKPMTVTMPCVLLLLDVWPLKRIKLETVSRREIWRLVREKIPFFILTAVVSVITIRVITPTGALMSAAMLPFSSRAANALISFTRYLGQVFWPVNLSAYYPLPDSWPAWEIAGAALLLVSITVLVVRSLRDHGYLAMGWFWFLGTLVPVIGLLQNGNQSMADRYTYIPYIGLFIALVWGAAAVAERQAWSKSQMSLAAGAALTACLAVTHRELPCWHDSVALFTKALRVTTNNSIAHNNLGLTLERQGKLVEAIEHYREAVRISPAYFDANRNLADALRLQGNAVEAIKWYREILRHKPDVAVIHAGLAMALSQDEKLDEAEMEFRRALKFDETAAVHNNLASILALRNRPAEAMDHYRAALKLGPDWDTPLNSLAWLLATQGDPKLRDGPAAVKLAQRACELTGQRDPLCLNTLAAAYAETGDFEKAVSTGQKALDAVTAGQSDTIDFVRACLRHYQNKQPYREGVP